ncbi:MAG: nucleotide exchange factor GrpE [Buchnera aphidicola (Aphis urticata)]|uniref:Protein GrpE n=1 Tax=Buchnera aphidicola (Aphis urticata) TaxID=2708353 RepID=A0AAJ4KVD1_9GAMM|nr:MAG: nucleotide exchange factor GrpE [Buchnera aphidicola (Aphis urticata)]
MCMTNEKKIKNEIIGDLNKEEIINDINNENHLINTLKNQLKISKEKITEVIVQQNQEALKVTHRLKSEIKKYQKFSLENLIVEFLSIIDNIERAFILIQQKKENIYIEILNNIEKILSLIKNMLIQFNVSKISDIKVAFNPNIHQAISIRCDNTIEPNIILEVMQSGYIMYNSRLLRPAMVVVSNNSMDNS